MKLLKNCFFTFLIFFTFSGVVFADYVETDGDADPKKLTDIPDMFSKVFNYAYPFAGLICVVFIVMGGYKWMTSGGDPARVAEARGTLTWAIIGLLFTIFAVVILKFVLKLVE